jgi:hypothetical protein
MLLSAVAALALFAAPEATQSGEATAAPAPAAAAAAAKPAMRRVCYQSEVSGTRLPTKTCHLEPVKAAPKKEAEETAKDAPGA